MKESPTGYKQDGRQVGDRSENQSSANRQADLLSDKVQLVQAAQPAYMNSLLTLISTCTGQTLTDHFAPYVFDYGSISQPWARYENDRHLINYLLLIDDSTLFEENSTKPSSPIPAPAAPRSTNKAIFEELLLSRIESFRMAWEAMVLEKRTYLKESVLQILTSICLLGQLFGSAEEEQNSSSGKALRSSAQKLWALICNFISSKDCDRAVTDSILGTFDASQPVTEATELSKISYGQAVYPMARGLLDAIETESSSEDLDDSADDFRSMDMNDSFNSSKKADPMSAQRFKSDPTVLENGGYRQSIVSRLELLCARKELDDANDSLHRNQQTAISYVLSLSPTNAVASRATILEAIKSDRGLTRSEACDLLTFLGEELLSSYNFERSEAPVVLCLEAMTELAELWTVENPDDELYAVGEDLYKFFIKATKRPELFPPNVQINIVKLLLKVLKVGPAYADNPEITSPRTSLMQILETGDIGVKFHLTGDLCEIFGLFVLREHDSIFDDVLDRLPKDGDWKEGIALRLFVLARLASKWHTLLRRSVYHIFETPGSIPNSTMHASQCMRSVAKALHLEGPQEILTLFGPQLLYTWLETQELKQIPYSIFGYSSLKDLLTALQDEIVGQVVMRSREDESTELARILGVSFDTLLKGSFARAEAYSLARDISVPPSPDSSSQSAESQVRKMIGNDAFLRNVTLRLPEIFATLFVCIDQEQYFPKALAKRPALEYASKALQEIRDISSSEMVLPPNQQPSFRAKYLLDELEYFCKRTGTDIVNLWSAPLITFIYRTLLDRIHPALGSLHACSIVRRLRIAVCLAGEIALEGYPLEMMLHALRPLLSESQCAEDAIGLVQYLIAHGRSHLIEVPSFTIGFAVSTLISLRFFLNSKQDSTTQESQYKAVLSRAQSFHGWLSSFMEEYNSPSLAGDSEAALRRIVRSASQARAAGTSSKGTYEGDLLREILDDQRSGRLLLSSPASSHVLGLLCRDFRRPWNCRDDLFGDDELASAYMVSVWKSVRDQECKESYLLWAARVLGRAYAATGRIDASILQEHDPGSKGQKRLMNSQATDNSRSAILRILVNMLQSDSRRDASLAESTLRRIVSGLETTKQLPDFQDVLNTQMLQALLWASETFPVSPEPLVQIPDSQLDMRWIPSLPTSQWIKSLVVQMLRRAPSDPVIGALSLVALKVEGFANSAFPFVLHIVLLEEIDKRQYVRQKISEVFKEAIQQDTQSVGAVKAIVSAVLYLREQALPNETTMADRESWLDVDYIGLARAAAFCNMFRTAFMFVEIQQSQALHTSRSSRRSSALQYSEPTDLLVNIFKGIDDPDYFYGVRQQASLDSVMRRLDYEKAGLTNLSFQGASYDSQLRISTHNRPRTSHGIVRALNNVNLSGLASALLLDVRAAGQGHDTISDTLHTAMRLDQWDIPVPSVHSEAVNLYRAYQCFNSAGSITEISEALDKCFLFTMKELTSIDRNGQALHSNIRALAILTEIDETITIEGSESLDEIKLKMLHRDKWMETTT